TIFSENDTEYARPILQIRDIARRYGCTVILIHHSNSEGNSRGTKAIHNSVDEVWGLTMGEGDHRLLKVQKTRLGRPPGRYKFAFEEDFSFRYLGEDMPDEFDEDHQTQEVKIRLWLSEESRQSTAFAPMEVAEKLGLSNGSTRRALYELWAKGLVCRKRPKGSSYYLYYVKKNPKSDRSITRDRNQAIGHLPIQEASLGTSDRAIGEKHKNSTVQNGKNGRSLDRFDAPPHAQQEVEGDQNPNRLSDQKTIEPPTFEDELTTCAAENLSIGDTVLVLSSANWLKNGSDKLPWEQVPKSRRGDSAIPINTLSEALFHELQQPSRVLGIRGDRVRVRNQTTGRNSVFIIDQVRVTEGKGSGMKTTKKRGRSPSPDWKTTGEICVALNCTRQHLATLRKQGVLKPKIHYRNISPYAALPTYRWHLSRIEQSLSKLWDE
ncbi:MAG: hypothetical protein HC881_15925, partial [Leptolyngbyaceae cyanobacterium SL_7_1]|nr:hypothetical protein [Leptolyngbyaceae cyanobacterium SL_7_1]